MSNVTRWHFPIKYMRNLDNWRMPYTGSEAAQNANYLFRFVSTVSMLLGRLSMSSCDRGTRVIAALSISPKSLL